MTDKTQERCPLCGEAFKLREVIVNFEHWGSEASKAHFNCLLFLSTADDGQKERPRLRRLK